MEWIRRRRELLNAGEEAALATLPAILVLVAAPHHRRDDGP